MGAEEQVAGSAECRGGPLWPPCDREFTVGCGRSEKFFAPAALAHLQFVAHLLDNAGKAPEIVGYMIRVGGEQLFSGLKSG